MTVRNVSERCKVLFIPAWYPTAENPISAGFVRDHARAASIYDDVTVLYVQLVPLLGGSGLSWREGSEDGVPTIRMSVPNIKGIGYTLGVMAAFQRLRLRGYRPDLVHAHVYLAGVPAAIISKLYRLPLVTTEHWTGFPMRQLSPWGRVKARIAHGSARYVLPVSHSLRRAIASYGINANFKVVPNTVDTELFRPKPGPPNSDIKHLICVAILDQPRKGIDHLLRAMALLAERRADCHLHIAGDGPRRAEYEELAAALGVRDFVTFHGRVDTPELVQLLHQAHLFVLPSLFENFSVATAEALATGTPVLVTRCGGPEDFVTPEVGLTVDAGDPEALAAGVGSILDRIDTYDPNAVAAYAQQFSPEAVGRQLHAVYRDSVARRRNENGSH